MPRSSLDVLARLVALTSLLLSPVQPVAVLASPPEYAHAQAQGETGSPTPTYTGTIAVTETVTGTTSPTISPTVIISATQSTAPAPPAPVTPTASPSLTPSPTLTSTSTPTATASATITSTATLTPTIQISPTPAVSPSATAPPTPTATVMVTPTVTPTVEPVNVGLTMAIDPSSVRPNALVTVTLSLSNPSQITIDNLTLNTTIPLELSYDESIGPLAPSYNAATKRLQWQIPPTSSNRSTLVVGYTARVAADAKPSALSLTAEISSPEVSGSKWGQASLIIIEPATPTPGPAGPPAQIQLGIKTVNENGGQNSPAPTEHTRWVAAYVVDANGLAVADGTDVMVNVQGGQIEQSVIQTKGGIAKTRFRTPRGQPFTVSARAGSVESTRQWPPAGPERPPLINQKPSDDRYGEQAQAIVYARNAVRKNGGDLIAENQTRRVDFTPNLLNFHLKTQDVDLTGEVPNQPADERLTVGFRLTGLRLGKQSLLKSPLNIAASDNWVTYQSDEDFWQIAYEVNDAAIEQYFIFDKGTPTDGDLVIDGVFQTRLRPIFLSDDEGIRFVVPPAGASEVEGAGVGYGPALVSDSQGRQFTAPIVLRGKRLQITVPARWLARAEFPVVIDPVIGPPNLVSKLQGEAADPAVASDGSNFLTVWEWNGDIFGRLIDAGGALSDTVLAVSQADGVQHAAVAAYNNSRDEYLVVWDDHRYGWTYNSLQGQRIDRAGQLIGNEIEILPPTRDVGGQDLAVSAAGSYLVVWSDLSSGGYGIYGQMMSGSGILSGTRLTINDGRGSQIQPAVAYDSVEDVFLVVWADKSGGQYDLYRQLIGANGSLLGSPQLLAGNPNADKFPSVASNEQGQFLVSWQHNVSSRNSNVHAVRVAADTGQAVGSILDIDSDPDDKEIGPEVTGLSNGNYLIIWRDGGGGIIQARHVDSSGILGSVLDLSELTTGSRYEPNVAHGGMQSLGVWADNSQAGQRIITGRLVDDGGTGSGDEIFISPYYNRRERTAITYNRQSEAFLLAWQQAATAPEADIFIRRVDGQGQPMGEPVNITEHTSGQERPAVAANPAAVGSSGYLAVWQDRRNEAASGLDIYGQRLDADGNLVGGPIAITFAGDNQANPALAYNSQRDEYLVVWDDARSGTDTDIYGQIVRIDGSLGNSFSLITPGSQAYPDVVYNPDEDNYLVVWEDDRPGTPGYDIYGQIIGGEGSLLGSDFGIATANSHQYDAVAAYGSNRQVYLVGWWDKRNGNWDIYGQVISGTGILSGGNFAISTPVGGTRNHQKYPDIATRPTAGSGQGSDDEFLLVWEDRRNGWARDIYGQRVDASGSLLDEVDTAADETDPTVNISLYSGSDYTERPVVAYSLEARIYLAGWNNRTDGGIQTRRYSGVIPAAPAAGFNTDHTSGIVPLTLTVSDTSSGTIATRTWNFGDGTNLTTTSSAPVSHTYLNTGTFSVVFTATNPGGSSSASTLITVTEHITPELVTTGPPGSPEDFEAIDLGEDPIFWLDQAADTTVRNDFETLWAGDSRAMGTNYTGSSPSYSTYAIPGWAVWQNYEYLGRMKMDAAEAGLGVSFYSRFPANEPKVYVLQRYAGTAQTEQFHLAAFGAGISLSGNPDLGVTPLPNAWYRFRVQLITQPDRVTIRAKVWADGEAESPGWQTVVDDLGPDRVTAGAVGLRAFGPGAKYFDNLLVVPLGLEAGFSASPRSGAAPLTTTFTGDSPGQVLTYTWNFGDGAAPLITTTPTTTHTYTQNGVYTVSLTVDGPGGSDTLTRSNFITASAPTKGTISPTGGVITSTDGRVLLDFAPGAVTETLEILIDQTPMFEITASPTVTFRATDPAGLPLRLFNFAAKRADGTLLETLQFQAPVTLTTNYVYSDVIGLAEDTLALMDYDPIAQRFDLIATSIQTDSVLYYDPDTEEFKPTPAAVPTAALQLTAAINHFSTYGVGGESATWSTPTIDAFEVALSRGSARFGYEILLPSGPNGFGPNLTLQYNSGIVNGLVGEHTSPDTGWVGTGWTLELGQITWQLVDTKKVPGKRKPQPVYEYRITLNGTNEQLLPSSATYSPPGSPPPRFQTEHQTFMDITAPGRVDKMGHSTSGFWTVVDRDGTTYYFGTDGQGKGSILLYNNNGEKHCDLVQQTYKLYKVVDVHGNSLEIDYEHIRGNVPGDGSGNCVKSGGKYIRGPVPQSFPQRIRYTTNDADLHAEYQVEFVTTAKGYSPTDEKIRGDIAKKLTDINIWHYRNPSQAQPQLVRRLHFEQDTDVTPPNRHARRHLLTGLQIFDQNGNGLPAMTFTYESRSVSSYWVQRYNCNNCGQQYSKWSRPFLDKVTNGYGASVDYDYEPFWDELFQTVVGRQVDDETTGLSSPYQYQFIDPKIVQDLSDAGNPNAAAFGYINYSRFYGFKQATISGPLGKVAKHHYNNEYDENNGPKGGPHILNGYELSSWIYDDEGNLYRASIPEWQIVANNPWPVTYVYQREQNDYVCDGKVSEGAANHGHRAGLNSCIRQRTTSAFDLATGNLLTRTAFKADGGSVYRTVEYAYAPNWQNHLLTLPFRQTVWSGLIGGAKTAETRYHYDGQGFGAAPIRGNLTVQRAWAGNNTFVDSTYGNYDRYGNSRESRTFADYGSSGSVGGGGARLTTIVYDEHGLLPTLVTNPLGHRTETEYDYRFQLPIWEKDANTAITSYAYDDFGRITSVSLPRCSSGPTFEAQYPSFNPLAGIPYHEVARQRDDDCSGAATYAETFIYYDGLGRKTQSQQESGTGYVLSSVAYDELGRAIRASVPADGNGSFGPYQIPNWSTAHTTTQYDLLDRVTGITQPDGSQAITVYNGYHTKIIDSNRHVKVSKSDPFGRLVETQEYSDEAPNETIYATTRYEYDVLDNLTKVTDASGYVTNIDYDTLGRKISMDDPDMGTWYYHYDAQSSLIAQVDAKNLAANLYYDALNRLTDKTYQSGVSNPATYQRPGNPTGTPHIQYFYDELNHGAGVGRQTSMVDEAGRVDWTYDLQGQITEARRLFNQPPFDGVLVNSADASGAYATGYTYDAADRVRTLTYPDGEVVTNGYSPRGLPVTLTTNLPVAGQSNPAAYIAGTTYDALANIRTRSAGNGVSTTYTYYAPNEQLNGIGQGNRLKSIVASASGGSLLNLNYTYDAVGNIITLDDSTRGQALNFGYDYLDRLVSANANGGSLPAFSHSYRYDEIGNITAKTIDGRVLDYEYAPNQPHAVTALTGGDTGNNYQYDANGNMISRTENGITYTQAWNAENKLARVAWSVPQTGSNQVSQSNAVRFVYDGNGSRLLKINELPPIPPETEPVEITTVYIGQIYEEQIDTTANGLFQAFAAPAGLEEGRNFAAAFRSAHAATYAGPLAPTRPALSFAPPTGDSLRSSGLAYPLLSATVPLVTTKMELEPALQIRLDFAARLQTPGVYGTYWNFDPSPWPDNGDDLTSSARYQSPTGPCTGRSVGRCEFDSRTLYPSGENTVESITAYGKYWNYTWRDTNNDQIIDTYDPWAGNGSSLTTVSRYASGPCAGQSGNCTFDSRAVYFDGAGTLVESITADGKYWNFNANTGALLGTGTLTSISRYNSGPCAGQTGPCTFDTRAVYTDPGGTLVETITVKNQYWNYNAATGALTGSGNLTGITHYSTGPCQGQIPPCTFSSRAVVLLFGKVLDSITVGPNPDTTPPPNPTVTAQSGIQSNVWQNSDGDPTFNWSAPGDPSGIAGYHLHWRPLSSGSSAPTSWTSISGPPYAPSGVLSSGDIYELWLKTEDNAGNMSTPEKVFIVRFDITPPANPPAPAAALDCPAEVQSGQAQYLCDRSSFQWSPAADSGGSGVAGYYYSWTTNSGDDPLNNSWVSGTTTPELVGAAGSVYYLRLRTEDNAGNRSQPVTLFALNYYDPPAPQIGTAQVNPPVFNPNGTSCNQTTIKVPLTYGASVPITQWQIRIRDQNNNNVGNSGIRSTTSNPLNASNQIVWTWDPTSSPANGSYTVWVRVWDAAGNRVTRTNAGEVSVDKSTPTLNVTNPADGTATGAGNIAVTGTAGDSHSAVTAKVNNQPVTLDGSGNFNKTVALTEGSNSIAIIVEDEACNTTGVTRAVTRDSFPPALSLSLNTTSAYAHVVSNTAYYGQSGGNFVVTAVATDTLGLDTLTFATTTADGNTYNLNGNTTGTQAHPYAFTAVDTFSGGAAVTAADRAGNAISQPFSVLKDAIPPDLVFDLPPIVPLRFLVSWFATDPSLSAGVPGSGVRSYTVRYRQGSGSWVEWLTTADLQAHFVGLPGQQYYFEVTARDNVSNSTVVESGPVTVAGVTKYYLHGDTRVAMRRGEEVYYLHGGHLNSTALTTDSAGSGVGEVRYLPYGQERWAGGGSLTDFGFTSQRHERDFGLMDYNARYYSPTLGRFISPDSIVPEPGSSSGFNRYRYARNNPLRYTDPSGHAECIDSKCEDLTNPHNGELIGNKEWVMPTFGNTLIVSERPPSAPNSEGAKTLDTITTLMDVGAFTASSGGFVGELMLGGTAALLPPIGEEPFTFAAGYAIGIGMYQPLNLLGDTMGFIGATTTIGSDIAGGNLYLSYDKGPGIVIPSSTQIAVVAAIVGALIPEAGLDAGIDAHAIGRLEGISIGALQLNPELESYFPTRRIGTTSLYDRIDDTSYIK